MIPDFVYGDENVGLQHLFDAGSIDSLCSMSPVVLYGDRDTGKTALAITLAVRWARLTSQRPLCFSTGQSLAEDFAAAVEIDDLSSFRARYRNSKLLIIDDLEPIQRKPPVQHELIHTIDSLAISQTPLIVTCGKLPATLNRLEPALASRLSAGYSTSLDKPGPLARAEIIATLVKQIDPRLDVEQLIAFCSQRSRPLAAPEIERIVTLAHQNSSPDGGFDYDLLSQLVTQLLSGNSLSVASIARSVARKMRVRLSDLRGSTRQAKIVRARGLAILLCRKLTSTSLQQIGQFFGGRDHSTVLHACRKTAKLVDEDPELSKLLNELQAELLN